jgi:MFS family permease
MVCVPFVLGWVIISMARNTAMLYVGRFLTGLCVGMLGSISPVFIAEISGPAYRGVLLATISFAVSTGILLANLLGTFLHWKLAAAISAIFPLICYIGVHWLPESPTWLAAKGRKAEATVAFKWYRGYSSDAMTEMEHLLNKHSTECRKQSWTELWVEMRKKSFLMPFFVMTVFFFVMQFSGVNAVAFYTVNILTDMGSDMDAFLATNIIGVVRVVMSVVACIVARWYGRRPLSITSSLGAAATLLGLGATGPGWVPVMLLVLYICFISIGLVPLPWVMVGEVFPAALRGFGSGVISAWAFLMLFAVVQTGPYFIEIIGIHGTFYIYGAVALGGAVFLYFFLPETRNKTLQDIEEAYRRSNRPV